MPSQSMAEIVSAPVEARVAAQEQRFFLDSATGRDLKYLAGITVPINFTGINKINSPELRERSIAGEVNTLLLTLQSEGKVITDLKGGAAVVYPHIGVEVGGGLNQLQQRRIESQVIGLARDSQEADFWQAALKMKGFNWRAAEKELGIKTPAQARNRLQELEDRTPDKVDSLTNLLLGKEPEVRSTSASRIKVGRNATILPAAQYAQVEKRFAVKPAKTTVQRVLPMLAVVGLGVALSSCASSPIEASPTPAAEASSTVQPTAIETATPTESATPTETPEPENRIAPKTPEEIYGRNIGLFGELEKRFAGGYFEGAPGLENIENLLFVDFSHEGEIRIVEANELDSSSWGIYSPKTYDNNKYAPAIGIRDVIIVYLFSGDPTAQRDEQIIWGDLTPGTQIFFSEETDLDPQNFWRWPDLATRENILRRFTPFYDERFTCDSGVFDGTKILLCTKK